MRRWRTVGRRFAILCVVALFPLITVLALLFVALVVIFAVACCLVDTIQAEMQSKREQQRTR